MSGSPADGPPPLEYATPVRRQPSWLRTLLIAGIVLMAIVGAMPFAELFMPRLGGHSREPSRLLQCNSRLRMIGLAIEFYANENGDRLPPDLGDVLLTQPITGHDFVCPSSTDTAAVAPTTQQAVALLLAPTGHHCSYFYVGDGLTTTTLQPDHVLAFELPSNHGGMVNVLFGDYHTDRLDGRPGGPDVKAVANLQADCAAGMRPIKLRP